MLFSEFSVVRPRLLSLWAFVQDGPPADCTTGSAVAYPIGQEGQDGKKGRKGRMGGMSGDVWVVLYLSAGGMTALAQKPDIKAAQAEIMKADEDFNQSVADWNRERFLSLIADGATFGGGTPNEQKGQGRDLESVVRLLRSEGPDADVASVEGGSPRGRRGRLHDRLLET